MKKIFLITILLFAISFIAISQGNYQYFPSAGFKVKCGCKLAVNSVFTQVAKSQGINDIIGAYICAENENDPSTGVIVNINICDASKSFQAINSTYHDYFIKKSLEKYASILSQTGISYEYISFMGTTALEYNFDQNGVPTKAILFFKNQKSYMLQLATRNGLTTKFNALKTSFELL